jgi:hypothetical protein
MQGAYFFGKNTTITESRCTYRFTEAINQTLNSFYHSNFGSKPTFTPAENQRGIALPLDVTPLPLAVYRIFLLILFV